MHFYERNAYKATIPPYLSRRGIKNKRLNRIKITWIPNTGHTYQYASTQDPVPSVQVDPDSASKSI